VLFKSKHNPEILTTEVGGQTGIELAVHVYSYNHDPARIDGVFGDFIDKDKMSPSDAQKVITHQSSKSSGLIEAVNEDITGRGLFGMIGANQNTLAAMEFISEKDRYKEATRVHPATGKSALDVALNSPVRADKLVGAIYSTVAEEDKPLVQNAYSQMVMRREKEAGADAFNRVQQGDESALPELAKKDFNTFLEFLQLDKDPKQWAGIILNEDEKGNSVYKDTYDSKVRSEVGSGRRDILDRLVGRSIANIELNGSEEERNTPIKISSFGDDKIIPAKLKEEGRSGEDIDKSFDDRMLFGHELMEAYKKEYNTIQKDQQIQRVPADIVVGSSGSEASHVARLKRENSQSSVSSSISDISESSSFVDAVTNKTKQMGL